MKDAELILTFNLKERKMNIFFKKSSKVQYILHENKIKDIYMFDPNREINSNIGNHS